MQKQLYVGSVFHYSFLRELSHYSFSLMTLFLLLWKVLFSSSFLIISNSIRFYICPLIWSLKIVICVFVTQELVRVSHPLSKNN